MPHKKPMEAKKHAKSWHGRLSAEADSATAALLASLDVDVALWKYDIVGSLAHGVTANEGFMNDFATVMEMFLKSRNAQATAKAAQQIAVKNGIGK